MKFKEGDRVRVLRYKGEYVDFYGRISEVSSQYYFLGCCTVSTFKLPIVLFKPNDRFFGPDKTDYYVLAEDEEDTEEPVIQRTTDTHDPVNKPSHYMLGDIEVKDIIAIVADKYHKGSVAHNVASALEYQMRAPGKNGLDDIKKARKCLDFAIENWE